MPRNKEGRPRYTPTIHQKNEIMGKTLLQINGALGISLHPRSFSNYRREAEAKQTELKVKVKGLEKKYQQNSKRIRVKTPYAKVNDMVSLFHNKIRSKGLPMSGIGLQVYARVCVKKLLSDPTLSEDERRVYEKATFGESWVDSLKKRLLLSSKSINGERASVPTDWEFLLSEMVNIVNDFELPASKNYNFDETGLFYRCMPKKTFGILHSICLDSKGNIFALSDSQIVQKISKDGYVSLFAGVIGGSDSAKDGTLLKAVFYQAQYLAIIDANDTIFICEGFYDGHGGNRIRKISKGYVETIAGGNSVGFKDGQGADAQFQGVTGITFDNNGDLLILDKGNSAIRVLNSTGYVSTLVKSKGAGFVDGDFSVVEFSVNRGITVDQLGDIYFGDPRNSALRNIDMKSKIMSTIIGDGNAGFFDGSGTSAELNDPRDIKFDLKYENLYIADYSNSAIRVCNMKSRFVSTIARFEGVGFEDGYGGNAKFSSPRDSAFDSKNNVYISDYANHVIRKISPDGTVSKYAGFDGVAGNKDGLFKDALFHNPIGIIYYQDNLYVMERGNRRIRIIYTKNGTVSTIAGNGEPYVVDGFGIDSSFLSPNMATIDTFNGLIYITDWEGQYIRRFNISSGYVEKWAGIGVVSYVNGYRLNAGLNYPEGICIDKTGIVYFTDQYSEIRKIDLNGIVSTVAGDAYSGKGFVDGTGKNARFIFPNGLACSQNDSIVYIAEMFSSSIRSVDSNSKVVKTVVGVSGSPGIRTGRDKDASFSRPDAVSITTNGYLYISDSGNNAIKKMHINTGRVLNIAGYGAPKYRLNETFVRRLENPQGMAINPVNNLLYISDTENNMILRFENGKMNIHAGFGSKGFYDNQNDLRDSEFYSPNALAFSSDTSSIVVADTGNHVIRKVTDSGVTTIAGTGYPGNKNGPALSSMFNAPKEVILDIKGIIYVSDTNNHMIKTVSATAVSILIGSVNPGLKDGKGFFAQLNQPVGLHFDKEENYLYIAYSFNHAIRRYDMKTKDVKTIAGNGSPGFDNWLNGTFKYPISLAMFNNMLYVADKGNKAIRKIDLVSLNVSTVIANEVSSKITPVKAFNIDSPSDIVINAEGKMFILDAGKNQLLQFNLIQLTEDSQTVLPIVTIIAFSVTASIILAALTWALVYRRSHKRGSNTAAMLMSIGHRSTNMEEGTKTISVSRSVVIALPGYLAIENFFSSFDIDNKFFKDSFMSGGTAAVKRGLIKDPDLIAKHGFTDVAVKVIKNQENDRIVLEAFKYEVSIMASLPASPYLVHMVGYSVNPMIIVMKYYRLSLLELMEEPEFQNSIDMKLKSSIDIAKGMEVIHSKDIVHFDLKPGNVLVDVNSNSEYTFVICDFGFADYAPEAQKQFVAGMKQPSLIGITIRYAAPEVQIVQNVKKVDVYSYAMILFQIWTDIKPWGQLPPNEIEANVLTDKRPEIPKSIDPNMKDIIVSCWDTNPIKRKSFSEIIKALK